MLKLIVLASGNGSTLQAIIDAINAGIIDCSIERIITDRECFAIQRAKDNNINSSVFDRKILQQDLSAQIAKQVELDQPDLIILAGFLSILDNTFVNNWTKKIINIHPSLLPKYGGQGMWGIKVHQQVIANKELESGCTIHYVDAGIDTGEIILQKKFQLTSGIEADELQSQIQMLEKQVLIEALQMLITNKKL